MNLNPVTSKPAPTSSFPVLSEPSQLNDKFESLFQNILADQASDNPEKCKKIQTLFLS